MAVGKAAWEPTWAFIYRQLMYTSWATILQVDESGVESAADNERYQAKWSGAGDKLLLKSRKFSATTLNNFRTMAMKPNHAKLQTMKRPHRSHFNKLKGRQVSTYIRFLMLVDEQARIMSKNWKGGNGQNAETLHKFSNLWVASVWKMLRQQKKAEIATLGQVNRASSVCACMQPSKYMSRDQ